MKIILTGANGFVGRYLSDYLTSKGIEVAALQRKQSEDLKIDQHVVGDFADADPQKLSSIFKDYDIIVHLAARAHVMNESLEDPYQAYLRSNVTATENILSACEKSSIKKFIFISSIKVNGEQTHDKPFSPSDTPNPQDDYSKTKKLAEELVKKWSEKTGIPAVSLRPPLVYGPHAKGNLQTLGRLMSKNIPLPILALRNTKRSMISLLNLSSVIESACKKESEEYQCYTISDGQDPTLLELIDAIATAMYKSPLIFYFPPILFKFGLGLIGKRGMFDRLSNDLQVDNSNFVSDHDWKPKADFKSEIKTMVDTNVWQRYPFIKRLFDLSIALSLSFIFSPLIILVFVMVKVTSKGPALYWSERVGTNNQTFKMPKFRTMKVDTPQVATHLLTDSGSYLTSIGNFLRKSSLDELPQLYSILVGDMSLVGPRPALFNQHDLIELRTKEGVQRLKPGITGWAQINGRDTIPIPQKVQLDAEYLDQFSMSLDLKILFFTGLKVLKRSDITH